MLVFGLSKDNLADVLSAGSTAGAGFAGLDDLSQALAFLGHFLDLAV